MFIFGWGPRETLMDSGQFDCPVCKRSAPYSHLRKRRWMTFFFFPIIPISSSTDFVRCQGCQSVIPIDAFLGQPAPVARLSRQALFAMICGLFALLTFCIFRISFPNALCAVAVGHIALRDIKKNRPNVDGRSLAIAGLAFGYPALILSSIIGWNTFFGSRRLAGDPAADRSGTAADTAADEGAFGVSDSPNEAFKNAEYEIAAKRDQPPGRGNTPRAVELANLYAQRIKEVSDEMFTSDKKPLLQLSDGEYLTFCELHPDRCLFLVHVPSYRKFTGDAKRVLAQLAWLAAQATAAGELKGEAKLGVGLRGVLTYGDILIGTAPASSEETVTPSREGDKDDLIAFFIDSAPSASDPIAKTSDPSSQGTPGPRALAQNDPAAATPDSIFDPPATSTPGIAPSFPSADPFVPLPSPRAAGGPSRAAGGPSPRDIASSKPNSAATPARARDKPKIDFVNQITVQRIGSIENESWGSTSIALSPDGKWLATGKLDEKLSLFETSSGNPIGQPYPMTQFGQVTAVAFSATGDYLIAGGYSGRTMVWQVMPDGRLQNERETFRFDGEVSALATSPKFSFFIGTSRKGTVAWQPFGPNQAAARSIKPFEKDVHAVWLPASGDEGVATDGSRLVRFSLRDGELKGSDNLGIKNVRAASFSRSGKRLAVADSDTLHLFDLTAAPALRSVKLPRGELAHGVKIHPQETWIAVGMRGKVAIFDFERAELVAYADTESVSYQKNLDFSADGNVMATTSESARGKILLYRLAK